MLAKKLGVRGHHFEISRTVGVRTLFLKDGNQLAVGLIRDGIATLGIKLIYVLLQFGINVFLARILEPSGYGVMSLVLSVVTVSGIIGNLGFPGFLVRTVAIYKQRRQFGLLRRLLKIAVLAVTITSCFVAISAFTVVRLTGLLESDLSTPELWVGLFLLPVLSLIETIGGALRGLGYPVNGQLPGEIVRPGLLLIGVVMLAAVLPTVTPTTALLTNLGASILALIVGVWLLVPHVMSGWNEREARVRSFDWIKGALPFSLLSGTQLINHHVDVLMLGALMDREAVGLYRVAVQIADGLGMVLLAITLVITPQLARMHAAGDLCAARRLLVAGHRIGVGLLLPPVLGLVATAGAFLETVFGYEYGQAADALVILALGKLAYAAVGFSGAALTMFGFASIAVVANGFVLIFNIAMNYVLIPIIGIAGAATATALSAFAINFLLAYRLKYALGASVTAFARGMRAQ